MKDIVGSHYTRGSPWGLLAHGKVDTTGRVTVMSPIIHEGCSGFNYYYCAGGSPWVCMRDIVGLISPMQVAMGTASPQQDLLVIACMMQEIGVS